MAGKELAGGDVHAVDVVRPVDVTDRDDGVLFCGGLGERATSQPELAGRTLDPFGNSGELRLGAEVVVHGSR